MNPIIVEDSIREACVRAEGPLEFRDREGRVLGYFIAADDPAIYRLLESTWTEEELQDREREDGGRALEEILRDLQLRP
jgi:hypothetical protein